MRITGAILAGGESRRMGRDKALLRWQGQPLLAHAIARLRAVRPVFAEIMVVGDRPAYHEFGARVVADHFPGAGPLGGIATALREAGTERVFVVACDMIRLNPRLIGAMIERDSQADVLVPRRKADDTSQGPGGVYETLHAVYNRRCLGSIEERLARGERQVVSFYDDVQVEEVTEEWMRTFDPDLESLLNINRPEEFEEAKRRSSDQTAGSDEEPYALGS